jgi:dTDP-4-amino-4,6-dideoxygalactose transaminase
MQPVEKVIDEWSSVGPVPLVDLRLQIARVEAEVGPRIAQVIQSGAFVLGPEVERFEREFAAYSEVAHCIGVANGTDAVELALRGAGVGPGDEVIIPANTFVATAEAVARSGARVVLADITDDYLIDPASVAGRVTGATRAVVAVHLYGQMAPMSELRMALPDDVILLEDAAQSQGARQHGRPSGSIGVATGTSFYPGKNLGAFGDAGAVLTDSDEVAEVVYKLRNHGGVRRYEHVELGCNSRLDSIQAAVLSVKLQHLDRWNEERKQAAVTYADLLAETPEVSLPKVAGGNEHVWHLYEVRVPNRDEVLQQLSSRGIGAGLHYPAPIHALPAFEYLGHRWGDFPVTESAAKGILSLPLYPGITTQQQEFVVHALREAI